MSIQERFEKYRVLIVDSNAENCEQLKEIISPFYEVVTASPEEAVSVISENCHDIATAIIEIRKAIPIVKELRGAIPTEKFPVLLPPQTAQKFPGEFPLTVRRQTGFVRTTADRVPKRALPTWTYRCHCDRRLPRAAPVPV